MKDPEKDYIHRSWLATAALIVVLVGVSFIPPQEVWGLKLRRANILSDLISFDDAKAAERSCAETPLFDEEEFHIDLAAVVEQIEADTLPREAPTRFEWILAQDTLPCREGRPDTLRRIGGEPVPVEDFSDSGLFAAFCDTLLQARRPVRIAFLGDSFVEGDILTADLREALQSAYGNRPGGGAGFAPMASPLTGFRRTIRTQSKGWTAYPACELLRLGLGLPACGRGLDALGEHRLPPPAGLLHHGPRLLPLAARQPRRGDAQRFAAA